VRRRESAGGEGKPSVKRWFNRVVLTRRWLTFLVMGVAFFVFGLGTLNIVMLLTGTVELLADNGLQAARDGGLRQLLELIVSGYGSMAGYVVFKACEYSLVRHVVQDPE
jgi:hypothetical protein